MAVLQHPYVRYVICILCEEKITVVSTAHWTCFSTTGTWVQYMCKEYYKQDLCHSLTSYYTQNDICNTFFFLGGGSKRMIIRLINYTVQLQHTGKQSSGHMQTRLVCCSESKFDKIVLGKDLTELLSPYMRGNLVCCWAHLHGLAVWTLRDFSPALMED